MKPKKTLLRQARLSRGLPLLTVARAVGTDIGNLSRIERGLHPPKKDLARAIYDYYGGLVPLAVIYDPTFAADL